MDTTEIIDNKIRPQVLRSLGLYCAIIKQMLTLDTHMAPITGDNLKYTNDRSSLNNSLNQRKYVNKHKVDHRRQKLMKEYGLTGAGLVLINLLKGKIIIGSHAKNKKGNDFGGDIEPEKDAIEDNNEIKDVNKIARKTAVRECYQETLGIVQLTDVDLEECSYYDVDRWDPNNRWDPEIEYKYRVFFKIYNKDLDDFEQNKKKIKNI